MFRSDSRFSSRSKLARYKRFQYRPREYDPIKEDIVARRQDIRDNLKSKNNYHEKALKRDYFPRKTIYLLGTAAVIFFFAYSFIQSQKGSQLFGSQSDLVSIGAMIIFALVFIRISKRS